MVQCQLQIEFSDRSSFIIFALNLKFLYPINTCQEMSLVDTKTIADQMDDKGFSVVSQKKRGEKDSKYNNMHGDL